MKTAINPVKNTWIWLIWDVALWSKYLFSLNRCCFSSLTLLSILSNSSLFSLQFWLFWGIQWWSEACMLIRKGLHVLKDFWSASISFIICLSSRSIRIFSCSCSFSYCSSCYCWIFWVNTYRNFSSTSHFLESTACSLSSILSLMWSISDGLDCISIMFFCIFLNSLLNCFICSWK